MEVGGILRGIESNMDKIGTVVGAYSTLAWHAKGWGLPDAMSAGYEVLNGLIRNPHFPNLQHMWFDMNYLGSPFKPILITTLSGYFLAEVGVHPVLTRVGNVLYKGGMGALIGNLATELLIYSGASNSPTTLSNMGSRNFGSEW